MNFVPSVILSDFLSWSSEEKTAFIQGVAKKEIITVAELKHYAEDAGKSAEEIAKITEPEVTMSFEACKLKDDEFCNVTTTINTDFGDATEADIYRVSNDGTTLEVKDDLSSTTINSSEIVDLSGRGTCIILAPNQEYQGDFASGIYWVSCKDQRVKCMVN